MVGSGVPVALLVLAVAFTGCGEPAERPGAGPGAGRGAGPGDGSASPVGPIGTAGADPTAQDPPPCHPRTDDVGLHEVYVEGRRQVRRLCAVHGFPSDDAESRPGSPYYVDGAEGRVIVASTISQGVVRLVAAARRHGVVLAATSSFRTHRHQRDICRSNAACREGDFTFVAPPGWSHHQSGTAIDLRGTFVRGEQSCAPGRRAVDPASPVWRFLEDNARRFGLRQYAAESWHWDASGAEHRC